MKHIVSEGYGHMLKRTCVISIRKNALYFMRMIELLKSRIKRMQSAEQNMKKSIYHQEKRCGDEFMDVIYHTGKMEIEELLQSSCREKDRLNSNVSSNRTTNI